MSFFIADNPLNQLRPGSPFSLVSGVRPPLLATVNGVAGVGVKVGLTIAHVTFSRASEFLIWDSQQARIRAGPNGPGSHGSATFIVNLRGLRKVHHVSAAMHVAVRTRGQVVVELTRQRLSIQTEFRRRAVGGESEQKANKSEKCVKNTRNLKQKPNQNQNKTETKTKAKPKPKPKPKPNEFKGNTKVRESKNRNQDKRSPIATPGFADLRGN